MKNTVKEIKYDNSLNVEAYRFDGIVQPFPNHFHNYYVIGFIEKGSRFLSCKNTEYIIKPNDILLFNPNDNHSCTQSNTEIFNYSAINIPISTMMSLTKEIVGKQTLINFSQNVINDTDLLINLKSLHQMIMNNNEHLEKEEKMLILVSMLIEKYCKPSEKYIPEYKNEIEKTCSFIQKHFTEHISLEELCRHSNLSKSTLIRAFTKAKGVTPYRYLQSIRISKSKSLLQNGVNSIDASQQTGFSDQSHFTNYFNMYIGLSPAMYKKIFTKSSKENKNEK
ncbi:MAG: AraC family transcriptional regulator [Acetobacter sp.]|nr:AraC family transcriptional regulator [Bacteroides sp.]MCM1340255.1 AraC family transcriptional regulator [Acetobacter sp.]MCM1432795.1 AraC family transcriptional regulator [Clostridiales bacterium]